MSFNNPDGGNLIDNNIMEEKLSKVRSQVNSKLENQKNLAVILSAVEENIEEQNNEKTPVSYFVSFLSILDESIKDDTIIEPNIAASTAYFLDIVFPFTPKSLLQSKFGDILVKLAVPLTNSESQAPLVRSTVGALEALLLAQNHQQWISSGNVSPKRAFVGLLELSLDPRPKVRRRAQEAVHNILSNPPISPSPIHAASMTAGEFTLKKIVSLFESEKKNHRGSRDENKSQLIHALQLVAAITSANAWPAVHMESLFDVLLDVSRTSDQFLISNAFSAFEGLFKSMVSINDIEKFSKSLNIIFELKPSINDGHLAASWLAVVAKGLENFSILSPISCIKELPNFIPIISQFLGSDTKDIYFSASQCLIAVINQTIPDESLLSPSRDNDITEELYELIDETVEFLGSHFEHELLSIKYQAATREVLDVIAASLSKLRFRCNPEFLPLLETVGAWRTSEAENFPFNKEAENVIASSISAMGAEVVLGVLPLNLNDSNQKGRAWLLPILRDNVRFSELAFYRNQILPLADVFEKKIINGKQSLHNKIFKTIIDQIWSLLPHFCDLPKDLRNDFDNFGAQLSDLSYSRIDLRVPICQAFKALIESNFVYANGALSDDKLMLQEFPMEEAKRNISFMSERASKILSVLFNIFSSTVSESRGLIFETIDVYLKIIPPNDLEKTFNKVCELLKSSMDEDLNGHSSQKEVSMSVTMLDLVVVMSKYLPKSSHNILFSIFASVISSPDLAYQKRAYRILTGLGETDDGLKAIESFLDEILDVVIKNGERTNMSARASRLGAILMVLDVIPQTKLYFVPAVLQEIILCTKDVNEKTRSLSFKILAKMGHLVSRGGVIENKMIPGFSDEMQNSEASLTEYFTMVSAGLASQLPHMISATITALSFLIFEFKEVLPTELLLEISSTVELFLTHNAREIAKAAIGYVKVEILSLPEDLVRSNLHEMLSKLMRWSHEHKGHFKLKVKHILERLIRKFGLEVVEEAIPENDRRLIANIRKSKNRARNKRAKEQDGEGKKFISAYEEALYDSDESDDVSDDEPDDAKKQTDQYILNTGDEPLNLLDRGSLAHISSSKPSVSKKEIADKISEFKTENGKVVINDMKKPDSESNSGIDAYLDAVKQAPIRGQKNKLKYKKSKDQNDDDFDDSDTETQPTSQIENKKPQYKGRLKVSKPKTKFKARKKF